MFTLHLQICTSVFYRPAGRDAKFPEILNCGIKQGKTKKKQEK
jgi:hypothetical protein